MTIELVILLSPTMALLAFIAADTLRNRRPQHNPAAQAYAQMLAKGK